MMNRNRRRRSNHALGTLGLFLLLLLAKLAPGAYGPHRTVRQRLRSALARRAIDGLAAIGWLADRLPGGPAPLRNVAPPMPTPDRMSARNA
jgi:hypothetical protein